MSKKLIIMRHAQAESPIGIRDFERQLTQKGMRDAIKMGERLKKEQLQIEKIISSAAVRAKTTAQNVADQLGFTHQEVQLEEQLYNVGNETLLQFINHLPQTLSCVVIVGHNPTVSLFSQAMTGDYGINFFPASAAIIEFAIEEWVHISWGLGVLKDFKEGY